MLRALNGVGELFYGHSSPVASTVWRREDSSLRWSTANWRMPSASFSTAIGPDYAPAKLCFSVMAFGSAGRRGRYQLTHHRVSSPPAAFQQIRGDGQRSQPASAVIGAAGSWFHHDGFVAVLFVIIVDITHRTSRRSSLPRTDPSVACPVPVAIRPDKRRDQERQARLRYRRAPAQRRTAASGCSGYLFFPAPPPRGCLP